ncbi:MAG: hypothetical protein Q8907_13650 [Bacteroidota bacterium]|nr:hypothetical protein [Bacteroidota bacterium]
MPTRVHKILGFKWFAKCGTRRQGSYRWIGSQSRRPQHFIVCREAEHRQNKVLHAVIKMKEPALRRYFTGRSVKPLNGAEVKSFGTERLRKDNPGSCQARI